MKKVKVGQVVEIKVPANNASFKVVVVKINFCEVMFGKQQCDFDGIVIDAEPDCNYKNYSYQTGFSSVYFRKVK